MKIQGHFTENSANLEFALLSRTSKHRGTPVRIILTGNTCFKIANFREGLLHELLSRGHEVQVLAPFDTYCAKLKTMGCHVFDLSMDRNGTSILTEATMFADILRFFWHSRPHIVFSYTIKNNIYAGISCRLLGIPFVPNVTGLGPAFNKTGFLNRTVRGLYRLAFSRARTVFFQNRNDRAVFLQAGLVEAVRTQLLPGSGVNLKHFAAHPMPPTEGGVTFLLVSRLLWDKGIGLYAEAARAVRASHPNVRFQLLGPPDPASRSAIPFAQIQTWVREGVLDYLGQVSDVRPALTAAHCIVLPSWYREGTPRVLLEAAATGRPVITTDMPGCRDAVASEETGLLCAPRDAGALIAAIKRFIALPAEAQSNMGRSARARAEAQFDENHVIAAYLEQLPQAPSH